MLFIETLVLFLGSALTALAVENAVFARALGLSKPTLSLKSARSGILYGAVFIWVAVLSSLMTGGVSALLVNSSLVPFLRAPLYFLCVLTAYLLTFFGVRWVLPGSRKVIRRALPVSTFNTALFGVLYVSTAEDFDPTRVVGYALGAGLGYTIALVVIFYARKRLAISPVPRSFRGLPILLIYIGLLSMAIYGLLGHMLPV